MKKLLAIAGTAVLITGCSTTLIGFPERTGAIEGVYSRQVAFMPYTNQGIDVAPASNWYYGNTPGIKAYAAEGGIVYVNDTGSWGNNSAENGAELKNGKQGHGHHNQSENLENDNSGMGGNTGVDGEHVAVHSGAGAGGNNLGNSHIDSNSVGHNSLNNNDNNESTSNKDNAGLNGKQNKAIAGGKDIRKGKNKYFDSLMIPGEMVLSVNFAFNKSNVLYDDSTSELDQFISRFEAENYRLVLIGYTDDHGLDDYNIPFSLKRAEFVKERITKAHPAVEVTTIGSGPSPRLVDNREKDGRKTNRRVEIYLVKKG